MSVIENAATQFGKEYRGLVVGQFGPDFVTKPPIFLIGIDRNTLQEIKQPGVLPIRESVENFHSSCLAAIPHYHRSNLDLADLSRVRENTSGADDIHQLPDRFDRKLFPGFQDPDQSFVHRYPHCVAGSNTVA